LTTLTCIAVRLGLLAACATLLAMMMMIGSEVVLRSAFGFSLQIVDEYSGYMVVAVFFFGVAFSLRERALLRVEFLFNLLRHRWKIVVSLTFDLVALLFSVVITYELVRYTTATWQRAVFAPTPAMTPLYIPQLVMPIGMTLVCLVLLANIAAGINELRQQPRS
jgi:TRAP-type C4-dicarboxylate transport system permease small subunit